MEYFNTVKIVSLEKAPYTLFLDSQSLNAKTDQTQRQRKGSLLRVHFANGAVGHADCHPWQELGDRPLHEQLSLLSVGACTPLTRKSLFFAKVDAHFRSLKRNIFQDIELLPPNHMTIADWKSVSFSQIEDWIAKDFCFFKIKCGRNLREELQWIKSFFSVFSSENIQLRLDFNSSATETDFLTFFFSLNENERARIDFVEDPFTLDTNSMQDKKNLPYTLAIDRTSSQLLAKRQNKAVAQVFIIKPALQLLPDLSLFQTQELMQSRFVFTSAMDHPFGQLCALHEAARFYKKTQFSKEHCGFLTHLLYLKNGYSETFSLKKNFLIPSSAGTGYGFDSLLAKEQWKPLNEN